MQQVLSSPTAAKDAWPIYELTLACNGATRVAELQLATYIQAQDGSKKPRPWQVNSTQTQLWMRADDGIGSLRAVRRTEAHAGTMPLPLPLPMQALAVIGLFPCEAARMPFRALTPAVRELLTGCSRGENATAPHAR